MAYIVQGFTGAIKLLISGNPETYSAIFTTLKVSSLSISASLFFGIPGGFLLGYCSFPGRRQLRAVVDTLLALPTVVIGLFVYGLLSHRGPLGNMELLFTVPGIVIAQTLLVVPIVISLTAAAVEALDRNFAPTLLSLGARGKQIFFAGIREVRHGILAAAVAAYGRAIGEVGISMMIGGNIKWHTRTITTAIALETGKGNFAEGIALGIILLSLAFMVNGILIFFRKRI